MIVPSRTSTSCAVDILLARGASTTTGSYAGTWVSDVCLQTPAINNKKLHIQTAIKTGSETKKKSGLVIKTSVPISPYFSEDKNAQWIYFDAFKLKYYILARGLYTVRWNRETSTSFRG